MPQQPNILLIITDQQRGDCLSSAGHPVLLTPNMDAIGGAGARFSRAYVTCPSCIAARRSILSGQFPRTHGMVGYADGVEWNAPPTLPGVLRDAGYHTMMVGRSMHQHPVRKRYGYDQMITACHMGGTDYDEWLQAHAPLNTAGYYDGGLLHNDWTAKPFHLPETLHHTNWTVDMALEMLRKRDPSCPFFLTVSFLAPHPPLQPPAHYFERYLRTGVPTPVIGDWARPPAQDNLPVDAGCIDLSPEAFLSMRAGYYGLINHIDDQLRRLLGHFQRMGWGEYDNTVILFVSDHGEMLGDHYRFRKSLPYEASTHVPFLLQAPGRYGLDAGRVVDAPVCLEDIMPTLLDLAGVDIPDTVEGRSLLPLLRGETDHWRDSLHLEHAPNFHALTDGREKFIWHVADGREQFFDLTTDPTECRDCIADPEYHSRITWWRQRLITELRDRPEGFTDGERLIAGQEYRAVLQHAKT
jgi:arylsulfatase